MYESIYNPHHYGRGRVYFTPALRPNGTVDSTRSDAAKNWPTSLVPGDDLPRPPGRFVGNARGVELLPDTTRLNTSAWDTRSNLALNGISLAMSLYGHGGENLAEALVGQRTQTVGGAQTDTLYTGRTRLSAGAMLFTRHQIDLSRPVDVMPSWMEWSEGDQYQPAAYGIELMAGMSGPPGSSIHVAYTSLGGTETVEAMAGTDLELGIAYAGVNRADGSPVELQCYRARALMSEALVFINESTSTITLNFSLLPVRDPHGEVRWFRTRRSPYSVEN